MTPRPFAKLAAVATAATLAALLAACTPGSTEDPGAAPTENSTQSPEETAAPAPEPTTAGKPAVIEATCENIISEYTLEQFTDAGWSFKSHEFMVGQTQFSQGAYYVWGDYDGPASDNVAIFGWSTTTEAEAAEAQNELIEAGWLRENSSTGVYITEDPAYALARDEAGYGMTYHFGDGWVSVSETKQNLQLINAPRE